MDDATHQPTGRRHLLGLQITLLDAAPLGDISNVEHRAADRRQRGEVPHDDVEHAPLALCPHAALDAHRLMLAMASLLHAAVESGPVVIVDSAERVTRQLTLADPTRLLFEVGSVVGQLPVGADHHDRLSRTLHQQSEPFLAVSQSQLGHDAVGDISGVGHDAPDLGAMNQVDPRALSPTIRTFGPVQPVGDRSDRGTRLRERLGVHPVGQPLVVGMGVFERTLDLHRSARVGDQRAATRPAGEQQLAVRVHDGRDLSRMLEEHLELLLISASLGQGHFEIEPQPYRLGDIGDHQGQGSSGPREITQLDDVWMMS
jgi:hypothetical protein